MLQELALLTLGWLGGVLSPVLVEKVRAQRELTTVAAALKDELDEIGYRLALASHRVHQHFGSTDRAHLEWLKTRLSAYRGKEPTQNIAKYVEAQLAWSDEQMRAHAMHEAAPDGKTLMLSKFSMPFADARVPGWHLLPAAVRVDLLAIQGDIRLLNDAVEMSRFYFQQTFGSLSTENFQRATENLADVCTQYSKRCRYAADRMARLQSVL